MKTPLFNKKILISLSVALFCGACTYTPVYKDANYKTNTLVLNELKQSGKNPSPHRKGLQQGEYEEYFDQISGFKYAYQLVYHRPGNLTTDTDNYYIALVKIFDNGATTPIQATYKNSSLPVAVEELEARLMEHSFFVNIRLTRDQLIDAYENTGKMVISLVFGNENYNVIFPEDYLRNVLAKTTNLAKYKMDERIISATSQRDSANGPKRELFTYRKTFPPYGNQAALFPNQDREESFSFDLKTSKPALNFSVNVVRQYVSADAIGSQPAEKSKYIKTITMNERPGYEDSCAKVKATFDGWSTLKIKCNDVFGLTTGAWTVDLYNEPKCNANCSIFMH